MDATVTITGRVGTAVDFKVGRNRVSLASFRLGCTPRYRKGDEWVDDATTWLTVRAYRSLAEHIHDSLCKGDPVIVLGRLRTQAWVDSEGQEHERLVLEATTIGHDLTGGVASFRSPRRRQQLEAAAGPETAAPEDDGAAEPRDDADQAWSVPGVQPGAREVSAA